MDPEPSAAASQNEVQTPSQTDFYKVLGVSRNAAMKDITAAYHRLASVHHPDKNFDNPKAAEIYRQVNQAYYVLSDANRRHQYDLSGTVAAERDYEGVDVQSLGNVGRVFGAVFSKFGGATMPTQITQEVLTAAKQYAENIADAPLPELCFGHLLHERIERQHGTYYRLTITPNDVETGFLIHAYSKANNKFKLLVFDSTGEVHHIADSKAGKTISEACLYFTPFDTYSLTEAAASDLPYLFTSLEHFTPCNISLPAGQYVLCVYGDNFIGKSSVDIVALPVSREAVEVAEIQELDATLLSIKMDLSEFQQEYIAARDAFEKAKLKLRDETFLVQDLIDKREAAYHGMLASAAAAQHTELSATSYYADTVSGVMTAVESTSEWLTGKLTSGFDAFAKYVAPLPNKSDNK